MRWVSPAEAEGGKRTTDRTQFSALNFRERVRTAGSVAIQLLQAKPKEKSQLTNLDRVTVLSEALPYLQRFRGK